MKKRLLALALAAMMALSLTACGKRVDKTAVTKDFNTVSTKFDEIGALVNANSDIVDDESIAFLTELGNALTSYKTEIESDDLTQERADEIVSLLNGIPAEMDTIKANVEAYIANATAGMTEEQAAQLMQIATDMTDLYNLYVEYYDQYDDGTKQLVDDLATSIYDIDTVLSTPDATSEQVTPIIEAFNAQFEAALAGWLDIEAQLAG